MEKIEWLIDKLKRQYDAAAGAAAMLTTLQLLQQELAGQVAAEPVTNRKISVVMPAPQWNSNADSLLDAYEAESSRGEDEQKVVFELDPYLEEEVHADDENDVATETVIHQETIIPPVLSTERLATPVAEERYETFKARQISVEVPPSYQPVHTPDPQWKELKQPEIVPLSAGETPPSVAAVEMPKPVPDTDKKSLNDLLEKPAGEMYVRFQEPIKDLKKAISINDRYQYINNLFSGDEAAFDRSIKTINSFHVFSEAEYWIRKELATRYGWEESDQLVQQFYGLVSRRFS